MLELHNTVAVCIDIQEKLARVMDHREDLFKNVQILLSGLAVLDVPIILTEQNPGGLGRTIREVTKVIPDVPPISKMSFSYGGDAVCMAALEQTERKHVLLVGIEAHVCVYQTAVDLADRGYAVEVVSDCIASRNGDNKVIALEKMKGYGIVPTSAEIVLFELLKTAETPKFKEIAKIVK